MSPSRIVPCILLALMAAHAATAAACPAPSAIQQIGLPAHPVAIFNEDGIDPREAVDWAQARALWPIGRPHMSTAFLVSPCYALAAYHGIFGRRPAPAEPRPSPIEFIKEVVDGAATFEALAATPVIWGDGTPGNVAQDWVLLRVTPCAGERLGWLDLADGSDDMDLEGQPVAIAGYPHDRPNAQLWRDVTGRISGTGTSDCPGCLLNSAATSGGNSGSPIYVERDGALRVLGIQVQVRRAAPGVMRTYNDADANLALDIRPVARVINRLIEFDKRRFWTERPEMTGQNPSQPGLR